MPFFLPRSLVELEYSEEGEVDQEADGYLEEYSNEVDFAFFAVNFNYSKSDYNELTPKDKAFIRKAYENKVVKETTDIRNAVYNAIGNALSKKNSKFVELWKKNQKKADKEKAIEDIQSVLIIEEKEGKSWVDKIYKANNMKKPKYKGNKKGGNG